MTESRNFEQTSVVYSEPLNFKHVRVDASRSGRAIPFSIKKVDFAERLTEPLTPDSSGRECPRGRPFCKQGCECEQKKRKRKMAERK